MKHLLGFTVKNNSENLKLATENAVKAFTDSLSALYDINNKAKDEKVLLAEKEALIRAESASLSVMISSNERIISNIEKLFS